MASEKTTGLRTTDRRIGSFFRPGQGTPTGVKMTVILIALVAVGFMLYQALGTADSPQLQPNDLYMPVVDPILEPDRPDLIGDSLSDE